MSEKDNGGSAFPWCVDLNDCPTIQLGMTLRDYFAAKAMAACIGNMTGNLGANYEVNNLNLAKASYAIADAMLLERAK